MQGFLARVARLLVGTSLFALGIVMTMRANLGFAPWEVFHSGVGHVVGLTIGTVSIITSLIIVSIDLLIGEKLGIGTLVNMVLMGVLIDAFQAWRVVPRMGTLGGQAALLGAGLFTIAFGSYFYISSGFGAGPRDSLMVGIRRRTGLPVGLCRGALELGVVVAGWLLGGPVGCGTVVAAFGIGFCIQAVFSLMRFDAASVRHETMDATLASLRALRSGDVEE
jgi:uncharacterized protein